MSHALMFVAGFTFIFTVVFGAPAGFLGGSLGQFTDWLVWIGGAFLIINGVLLLTGTFARLNIIFNSFVPESLVQYL